MSSPTLPTFANISVAESRYSGHPFTHLYISVDPRGDAIDCLSFVGHVLKLAENHRVAVVDLTSRVEARFPPCWLELVIRDLIEHQVFVNVDDAAEQRYIEAHNATPEKKRYLSPILSKMTPDEVLNLTTKRCDCDIPRGRTDQFLGFQIQHCPTSPRNSNRHQGQDRSTYSRHCAFASSRFRRTDGSNWMPISTWLARSIGGRFDCSPNLCRHERPRSKVSRSSLQVSVFSSRKGDHEGTRHSRLDGNTSRFYFETLNLFWSTMCYDTSE